MIRYLLVMAMIILTPPKGSGGMPLAPKPAVIEARVWDRLAAALSFVESRNDDRAYNASSGALGRWQMKKVMSWVPKGQAVDGSGWVISFTLSFGLDNGTQIKFDEEGEYLSEIDRLNELFNVIL